MTRVVTGELHRVQRGRRKGFVQEAPPARLRRPARVAVMLALAHQMQRAIDRGELPDQAAVARRLGLTRARLTLDRTEDSSRADIPGCGAPTGDPADPR